ncbi:hypothetical protein E5676_scaffold600G001750 [Cucumis melo var. makuwa]|uniref:Uncharacterized protein n=1 Tax=Cucumis melo var. makuwa TaxID=1194695 RepID=A0A5D3DYL3_CUCMM|nr:hypothetical protein E5676_scaffold600G001750 [Cucumis melo var. makuwa]
MGVLRDHHLFRTVRLDGAPVQHDYRYDSSDSTGSSHPDGPKCPLDTEDQSYVPTGRMLHVEDEVRARANWRATRSETTVVKPKLELSTQEKAFMESRIRGDDNMEMEDDESIPDINSSDTNTPDHTMNNQSFEQSDSSPQLSPRRKQSQTVADQSEMHPITKKERCRSKKSNDEEQQSHSKSYKN